MARRKPIVARALLVAIVAVLAPLVLLNVAVGFFGRSLVFPLSPFFLRQKAHALAAYAAHRPSCLIEDHPPLAPLIGRAEARHRLPRGLLAAVVQVESEGRVHRISPAGAMGPAQITADTARTLRLADPFDPALSLDAAARFLSSNLHQFRDVRLAVAAYNAGPGAIVGRAVPHNGETEGYVRKVMALLPAPLRRR